MTNIKNFLVYTLFISVILLSSAVGIFAAIGDTFPPLTKETRDAYLQYGLAALLITVGISVLLAIMLVAIEERKRARVAVPLVPR